MAMADLKDDAYHGAKKTLKRMRGRGAGRRAFKKSFRSARSTYVREKLDVHIGTHAYKEMHHSMHDVKVYSGRYIQKLITKYSEDPDKLDNKLDKVIDHLKKASDRFSPALENYLKAIHDALKNSNEEFGKNNELLLGLLTSYMRILERSGGAAPKEMLNKLKHSVKKLEAKEEHIARSEAHIDRKLLKEDKRGHFHHVRVTWHRAWRAMKGNEHKQVRELTQNLKQMQADLANSEVKIVFLSRYKKHLKNMKFLAEAHQKVSVDLLRLVEKADSMRVDFEERMTEAKKYFSGYKQADEIKDMLKDSEKVHEEIRQVMEADIVSHRRDYYISKRVKKGIVEALKHIESLSERSASQLR